MNDSVVITPAQLPRLGHSLIGYTFWDGVDDLQIVEYVSGYVVCEKPDRSRVVHHVAYLRDFVLNLPDGRET